MKHDTQRLAYTVEQALDSGAFTSRNKLYSAIARGDLQTYCDGKRRMISERALQEYIARRERETAEGSVILPAPTAKIQVDKIKAA